MSGARARPALVGLVAAAVAAAACVEITAGPGGVQSIRLDRVPPSIIAGDVLRDSLGNEVRLRAVAFGERGDSIPDAGFTYAFLPVRVDTTIPRPALVVDAATGAVRADTLPRSGTQRVGAQLGTTLQVFDSVAVVRRPTRLAYRAPADSVITLRYLCTDPGIPLAPNESRSLSPDSGLGNASRVMEARLTGDSAGTAVPVPRYLVRFRIVSPAPATIPRGRSPAGDERPAFYLVNGPGAGDRPLGYDTTSAQGLTDVRLRVLPTLLSGAPGDTLRVVVEASALAGRTPVDSARTFTVRLIRRAPTTGSCP